MLTAPGPMSSRPQPAGPPLASVPDLLLAQRQPINNNNSHMQSRLGWRGRSGPIFRPAGAAFKEGGVL